MKPMMQFLISLPPTSAPLFAEMTGRRAPEWFATSDPAGRRVGSGGGTAHTLVEAWRATGSGMSLEEWLRSSRKLILHGGGHSRRLPAYAPVGKPLIPIPVQRGSYGQRLDQTLLDLQLPCYRKVLEGAPVGTVAMVASGDVLIRLGSGLPAMDPVDVILIGMRVPAETACHFGVFFSPRQKPRRLAFSLQKPSLDRLHALSDECVYLVDTGLWLLSERAVTALLDRCGWNPSTASWLAGSPEVFDLYGGLGASLGEHPIQRDPRLGRLSCTVAELEDAEFLHLGTSRQMIESVSRLMNAPTRPSRVTLANGHSDQITQNARIQCPIAANAGGNGDTSHTAGRAGGNRTLWIENATLPATWTLAHDHVLTGVPENTWQLQLEPGVCLDFVPVDVDAFCIRFYGIDDEFRGPLGETATLLLGRPAREWLARRGIEPEAAGLTNTMEIHEAPLFPVLSPSAIRAEFISWLFRSRPEPNQHFARAWIEAERLSAAAIPGRANLLRLFESQKANRQQCVRAIHSHRRSSVFYRLDLESTARLLGGAAPGSQAKQNATGSGGPGAENTDPSQRMREHMWRAAVLRHHGEAWEAEEERALAVLREAIVHSILEHPAEPRCAIQPDQIVWARSPVRLDLAGGWTDTPPYCIEHGGRVTNLAVDLNGQPPVQVFAKLAARPEVVIRSIDRGVDERIRTYEELADFVRPGNDFALARAALALAGFVPRFGSGRYASLREQLEEFGGGLEVSLLAAVPQGSGLGTSSILAATLLAALSELCGLHWDHQALINRTLALEQLLTTGGGWQDQAGGIFPGAKLVETASGLPQVPTLRWLPERLFAPEVAGAQVLLYYTGITRMAKGILREVVRGVLLNAPAHLDVLSDVGANALACADAIQRADWSALCASVRRSWEMNQLLDPATQPPEIRDLLDRVDDYLDAAKLLGAGGGGYLLMLAKDPDAALRIRRALESDPPNPRARFSSVTLSATGLEVTRS